MNELLIHNVEEKLKKEAEKVNGQKENAIKSEVIKALISFSKQEMLKERFRQIAKTAHPDAGGSEEYFITVKNAYEEAERKIQCI